MLISQVALRHVVGGGASGKYSFLSPTTRHIPMIIDVNIVAISSHQG